MTRIDVSSRNLTMQIDSTRVFPSRCRPSILCFQRLLWSRQVTNSYYRYRGNADLHSTPKRAMVAQRKGLVLIATGDKPGAVWHGTTRPVSASSQCLIALPTLLLRIEAKATRRGLWADAAPIPPWEFRHKL